MITAISNFNLQSPAFKSNKAQTAKNIAGEVAKHVSPPKTSGFTKPANVPGKAPIRDGRGYGGMGIPDPGPNDSY